LKWDRSLNCMLKWDRSLNCWLLFRKFLQLSYVFYGCGPNSRNAQFVVHQCISFLYSMRVLFMHHCLKVLHPSAVMEPERISKTFFNSLSNSAWTALQNIKRPAKGCIPNHYAQNVTWTSADYTELEVHTGAKKMDRVTVSHTIIRTTYMTLLASIRERLRLMDIKVITYEDFNSRSMSDWFQWLMDPCCMRLWKSGHRVKILRISGTD
jgi:hypothetical protein